MKTDIEQDCFHPQYEPTTLGDKESATVQPSKSITDSDPSSDDCQTELERRKKIEGRKDFRALSSELIRDPRYEVGAVKLKYPEVEHYGDIGRLILGEKGGVCTVVFGLVSALILLLLAIPPTFADIAILGYIDVASIFTAIGITMIATGVQSTRDNNSSPGSDWSAWPKENVSFSTAMVAMNNIVYAYSFAPVIPSFMNEMHTPKDYTKAIYTLGVIEIVIYTLIGSLVYLFVGKDVQSPALLSAGPLMSRIAFGVALPVVFISGSINTSIIARYIHAYVYRHSVVRYVNTKKGWITWISLVAVLTFVSWIVAQAIPVFSIILSISAALFISGLCFYIPPIMWFVLVKEGNWFSRSNFQRASYNGIVFLFGIGVLVCGMYANVVNLIQESRDPNSSRPFTCSSIA
ncbi:hypothetical protein N7519_001576 [Penicillium mononematosum]|uniref:uncharacterized protein n=1 Tax=Penicillium mononematosum TaxID=268346 RepID=UPI002547E029|nr:uncharacterized protein N7519_001576 [Penicillium mononematosum]KAJ6191555.1 hypothetical protein N7519_001576 [Penicillium mononematosum]